MASKIHFTTPVGVSKIVQLRSSDEGWVDGHPTFWSLDLFGETGIMSATMRYEKLVKLRDQLNEAIAFQESFED